MTNTIDSSTHERPHARVHTQMPTRPRTTTHARALVNFPSLLCAPRSYNKLTGTLPAELARWGSMEDLELAGNAFVGTLPPDWAGMRSLKTLFLQ